MGNLYLHEITARTPSSLAARNLPKFVSQDVSTGTGCINRVLRSHHVRHHNTLAVAHFDSTQELLHVY